MSAASHLGRESDRERLTEIAQIRRERYEECKGRWRGSRYPDLAARNEGLRYREWQVAEGSLAELSHA